MTVFAHIASHDFFFFYFAFFFFSPHCLAAYTRRLDKSIKNAAVLVEIQASELFLVCHLKCLMVQAITGLTAYAEMGGCF